MYDYPFFFKGMMFAESWISDIAITCGISQRRVSERKTLGG